MRLRLNFKKCPKRVKFQIRNMISEIERVWCSHKIDNALTTDNACRGTRKLIESRLSILWEFETSENTKMKMETK